MRRLNILFCAGAALALGAASVQIRAIDGVLFFVSSDCPVSSSYAPEIQRLCRKYGTRGVGCSLLYEDVEISSGAVRQHLNDHRYQGNPRAMFRPGGVTSPGQLSSVATPDGERFVFLTPPATPPAIQR